MYLVVCSLLNHSQECTIREERLFGDLLQFFFSFFNNVESVVNFNLVLGSILGSYLHATSIIEYAVLCKH